MRLSSRFEQLSEARLAQDRDGRENHEGRDDADGDVHASTVPRAPIRETVRSVAGDVGPGPTCDA
jgi:hypothetical protein